MKSFKRNYTETSASKKNAKSSKARRRGKRQIPSSNQKRKESNDEKMDVLAQLERQRSKNKSRPIGQQEALSPPRARIGSYIYDTTQKKYFPSSYKDGHSPIKIETQREGPFKNVFLQNKKNNFWHSCSICISTHQRQRIIQDWSMRIMGKDSHVIPVAIPSTANERHDWNCMLCPIQIPFHLQHSHVNTERCIR